jgi:hypothetical protein
MAAQFLLGGLFSAYAMFYSRSATLTSTAVFFALLVVLLAATNFYVIGSPVCASS